ncbi:ABC transporter substrate-binding protein [Pseudonocardia oroxyli]|uniref:ABC transporter substrate-binding protein n=1 Tax=Pseudonocardia oroxyli TaxID=366584 RepID=UPI00115FEBBC|nr:ABC transporter substrate-binding protein [Pseudonocardia oroxyli]
MNQTETQSLDPTKMSIITATRGDGAVGFALYGGLVLQDPATGKVEMSQARSLDSPDGVTWTLTLRPGLTFSDGTPFDAAAVKLNWERHAAPGSTSSALAQVQNIASMVVADPQTLRVTLKGVNREWARGLAGYPIDFIASPRSFAGDPNATPAGAGPFVLKEWVRDDHMTLVRNPKYFDAPRPYLDELVIRPIPDVAQRYNALASGQGQIEYNSQDFESIGRAQEAGYTVYTTTLSGGFAFALNAARAPFKDVRVRRAVALGLDLGLLNDLVQGGRAELLKTVAAPGTPFYDESIAYPAPDRVRAQQLFDEVSAETGAPIAFTILTNPGNRATAEGIQTLLAEYRNVKVSVESLAVTQPRVVQGDYDMVATGYFYVDPEPKLYDFLHTGSARNTTGFSDPAVDAALEKGRSSQNDDERREAYEVVQRALIDDVPAIQLWRLPSSLVHTDAVRGVETIEDGVLRVDLVSLAS